MNELTPELREKFLKFRTAYQEIESSLILAGASGSFIATQVWESAGQLVPLTPDELHLYKSLVAMHSVNGGELFALDQPDDRTE
ncbi:MAG: hypothetical protein ABI539_13170 [Acidobacteriota bacterium]